ncbi:gamma-glutamylaminecyclotransferase isoform X1 [Marmota marmota marmota]|uniref:gamma-glutamylaminecyclotransferase isoform X1 n=1 Tax=Marmota marmota marmota TaxID=9994 RepID=UPI002092C488|nr:gamma-glutamylaminecyclotransferase isoform X1 [Marmota marmota marmota]XP_048656622.1 gamma-glutamylaminecyclotransferase isoform X1 [Marmota marmota marmota]XP_048656623.1 gamma-glutamylaminecyclotransferase isoform X1 [Marmota marmota marmota]XP_048656624.1 gamma-glutamylaminecyclotransferase isoform X1 [Marmota marmota marmota]
MVGTQVSPRQPRTSGLPKSAVCALQFQQPLDSGEKKTSPYDHLLSQPSTQLHPRRSLYRFLTWSLRSEDRLLPEGSLCVQNIIKKGSCISPKTLAITRVVGSTGVPEAQGEDAVPSHDSQAMALPKCGPRARLVSAGFPCCPGPRNPCTLCVVLATEVHFSCVPLAAVFTAALEMAARDSKEGTLKPQLGDVKGQ